jgi:hypothetical protein
VLTRGFTLIFLAHKTAPFGLFALNLSSFLWLFRLCARANLRANDIKNPSSLEKGQNVRSRPFSYLPKFAGLFRGLDGVSTEQFLGFRLEELKANEASDHSVTEHSHTHVIRLEHFVLELRLLRFLPLGGFRACPSTALDKRTKVVSLFRLDQSLSAGTDFCQICSRASPTKHLKNQ